MRLTQHYKLAFAKRMREALADIGYNTNEQKALGELFGLSGQAVKKWLEADSMPSTARMPEIIDTLKVRRAWLMDGELPKRAQAVSVHKTNSKSASPRYISDDEMELVQHFRQLSASQRQHLSALVKSIQRQ